MYYYQFSINDFNNSTRHLSRIEKAIYRELIDFYYDTEKPIPLDLNIIYRKLIIQEKSEQEALLQVLNEFFIKSKNGYKNTRCEKDLKKYREKQKKCKEAGRKGGISSSKKNSLKALKNKEKEEQANDKRTLSERLANAKLTNNYKLITNNYKPIEKKYTKKELEIIEIFASFKITDIDLILEFYQHRKNKKASTTKRVINSIYNEFLKLDDTNITFDDVITEIITRNWQGFKANWINNEDNNYGKKLNQQNTRSNKETAVSRMRDTESQYQKLLNGRTEAEFWNN